MIPLGLKETKPLDWAPPLKVSASLGSALGGFLVSGLTEVRTQREEGSDLEPPSLHSQRGFWLGGLCRRTHPGTDVSKTGGSRMDAGSPTPALRVPLAGGCPSSQSLC